LFPEIISESSGSCTTSTLFFERGNMFYALYLHVIQWCCFHATFKGTETRQVICICVCVYVLNKRTQLLVAQKTPLRIHNSVLTFRIQINALWSKPYCRGRPLRLFWSVCTDRSRLPTAVVSSDLRGLSHCSKLFLRFCRPSSEKCIANVMLYKTPIKFCVRPYQHIST